MLGSCLASAFGLEYFISICCTCFARFLEFAALAVLLNDKLRLSFFRGNYCQDTDVVSLILYSELARKHFVLYPVSSDKDHVLQTYDKSLLLHFKKKIISDSKMTNKNLILILKENC